MTGGISDLLRVEHAAGAKAVAVKLPFAGDIDALAADPRVPGGRLQLRHVDTARRLLRVRSEVR